MIRSTAVNGGDDGKLFLKLLHKFRTKVELSSAFCSISWPVTDEWNEKIRQKLNRPPDLHLICMESRVKCAESNGQSFIPQFRPEAIETAGPPVTWAVVT
jgi:hypothetical protein